MSWIGLVFILGGFLLWAGIARRLLANQRFEFEYATVLLLAQIYARVFHRLRVEGESLIPKSTDRPLVIVSNHTAGIDPLLIQTVCPFAIKWMMAKDMMLPALDGVWRWLGVISVERQARDTTSARAAIRALARGEVVGVFPEGRIERPPHHILPFHAGIGLIVAKSGALVLPVVVDGTPQTAKAWESLRVPSRSRIAFHAPIDYRNHNAAAIADDLRARYIRWTGWPAVETNTDASP